MGRILLFYMTVLAVCPVLKSFGCTNIEFAPTEECSSEVPCDDEQECICTDCCNMLYLVPVMPKLTESADDTDPRSELVENLYSRPTDEIWNPPDMS